MMAAIAVPRNQTHTGTRNSVRVPRIPSWSCRGSSRAATPAPPTRSSTFSKEMEMGAHAVAAHHALQLRPDSQDGEGDAERDVLQALERKLEKVLADTFAPDYNERVDAARDAVRGMAN
jgi:hypothetical protein